MNEAMRQSWERAAAQTAKDHPVDDFVANPDLYRTESSPRDIAYQGETIAYYDTQLCLWRLGDRNNHSQNNTTFTSRAELLKALRDIYPDQSWG